MKNKLKLSSYHSFLQVLAINRAANAFFKSNPANEHKNSLIMDITEKEIQNLLLVLYQFEVKYLLVGGFATSFHGYPRSTHDLDLWIKNDPQNMKNLALALKKIEVPGAELIEKARLVAGFTALRFGDKGFELDLMHSLKRFTEFDFDKCFNRAVTAKFESVPLFVISKKDLIEEKKFVNRPKDQDDVENLEKGD